MIDDEKDSNVLQKGGAAAMDSSDVAMTDVSAESTRDFLTSLFDCEGRSDMLRYADAIIEVQKLPFEATPTHTLQSNITEIITKFVLQSPEGAKRIGGGASRQYNFIDYSDIVGCREEDAMDFLLVSFGRCSHELDKNTLSHASKVIIEATRTAILTVFVMIQRGYLEDELRGRYAGLVFVKRLLEDTITFNFVKTLIEYTAGMEEYDREAIGDVFNPVLEILRSGVIAQHFEENKDEVVHQILRVMNLLLNVRLNGNGPRALSILVTSRADFLPATTEHIKGREFGMMSFLGPFYAYGLESSSRRPNTRPFVDSEDDARKSELNMEQKQYINRMSPIRAQIHQMMLPMVSDPISRVPTLKWMGRLISANDMRTKTQYDDADVCPDHYMVNFLSVMYRFSEKIDMNKITMEYPFQPETLLEIAKETRIRMDEAAALAFATQFSGQKAGYHFPTVCFFLTIAAQQLVIPPLQRQILEYSRHTKDLQRKVAALREKAKNAQSAHERDELQRKADYENEHWKMMCRHLLCVKTQAQDTALMSSALDFVNKQMKFVMDSLCKDLNLMGDDSQMPEFATPMFCALPEHFIEDVFDFYTSAIYGSPQLLMEGNSDWVQRLTVLFTHYEYMKSPFLIAKLVRVLSATIQSPLWFNVVSLRMAQDHLVLRLIKFYSDFEDSGDFYEKFSVRGNIQYMLDKMREDMFYKSKFVDMARECGTEFIRFVNMVINDATWCIDESLSGLKNIHEIEAKMANIQEWNQMDQEARNQDLGQLDEAKRKVKGWLGTAKSNLQLILSITANSPEPFRTPALGDRLAAMLNHNLSQMLGNKSAALKVSNPTSYGWQPRDFVFLIISIYLDLNVPAFVKYIAYDERTYTPAFFNSVIDRCRRALEAGNPIVSFSLLERFQHLAEDVQKEYESKAELEEEYDDVPEEFKDPIMDAIMVDPVRLPSGHVMDRAVIERHLLSTPNNPFNRAPLTHGELVPDDELKAKIQEWIVQKRSSKKQ